jgi:hypothetical protein
VHEGERRTTLGITGVRQSQYQCRQNGEKPGSSPGEKTEIIDFVHPEPLTASKLPTNESISFGQEINHIKCFAQLLSCDSPFLGDFCKGVQTQE